MSCIHTRRTDVYTVVISQKKTLSVGGEKRGQGLQMRVTTRGQGVVTPRNQTPLKIGPQAGNTSLLA